MKATALENGLHHDWYIDERSDPEKATLAAAKYLKTLNKLFDGDWNLVLAAYNGGLGRVQRAMQRSGKDDFWELSQSSRYLPRETREYVPADPRGDHRCQESSPVWVRDRRAGTGLVRQGDGSSSD